MKILFVTNCTIMSGGTISMLNLIKGLHKNGHIIGVVTHEKEVDISFVDEIKHLGIDLITVPLYFDMINNSFLSKVKYNIRRFLFINWIRRNNSKKCLRHVIEEWVPDIVHTNVGIIHIAEEVCRDLGIKHVWHLREYQINDFNRVILPSKKQFEKQLNASDAVITISDDIRSFFNLGVNSKTIYNGIFHESETIIEYPKEKYFLCASRLIREKGLTEVLLAFAKFHLEYPDYCLYLAGFGDNEYIDELKDIARNFHCDKYVHFLGFVKDIKPLMQKATALIVASYYEGFGRMTVEALYCGCPVIGRNTGGTKEILSQVDSYPFDGDYFELTKKMLEVVNASDVEFFSKMKISQERSKNLFSIEQYVDNVMKLYESLLNI